MGLEGNDKLALQGFIMAAALLVQYDKHVARGVANHWANVERRLPHAVHLGLDAAGLRRQLGAYVAAAQRGDWSLTTRAVQLHRAA